MSQALWQQLPAFLTHIDLPNWPSWLGIVGASSAVSSIAVLSMLGLRNRIILRRERRDVALEVAVSLEGYARECRSMMHRADWAREEVARLGNGDAAKSATLPRFSFPERIQWIRLSHRVVSELRDFPANVHAGRSDLDAFAEFGDPSAYCEEVSLESAKAARDALVLARETRRKHGCVPWRPGAKDADLTRELMTFISIANEKRQAHQDPFGQRRSAQRSSHSASDAGEPAIAPQ
ncbi:hypothetical protein CBA19CS22_34545 [Caballeronia novacaledonica]|uniref:Uncharacterized protein n=1 Tax=Caballeronia novacaledonica TaxID=1544861 RepID=A0ACB5R3X4_9BURK|nr:hypothetical protein CBA19CS22_34545 [Caballeronia novacaledonica]